MGLDPKCLKLWQAYRKATMKYADLLNQGLAAVDDALASQRLEREIELAQDARQKAEQNMLGHQAARHPTKIAA